MSRHQNNFEPDLKPQHSQKKSQKLKEHIKKMLFCYMSRPKNILNHNPKLKALGAKTSRMKDERTLKIRSNFET